MISASIIVVATVPVSANEGSVNHTGYIIGGVIAFLILGYLIYTLIRPNKF
jgi:K+-transporting ATPase KdpF subunit